MSEPAALWDQVRAAFKAHQIKGIDHTPQMALDRIPAKGIRLSFNPDNCDVHEETLSLDNLTQLRRYSEDDDRPADGYEDKEPIVVLAYQGQRIVIDGRRRVTRWINRNDPTLRRVLIIEPKPAT